jgi:hypothetical protein
MRSLTWPCLNDDQARTLKEELIRLELEKRELVARVSPFAYHACLDMKRPVWPHFPRFLHGQQVHAVVPPLSPMLFVVAPLTLLFPGCPILFSLLFYQDLLAYISQLSSRQSAGLTSGMTQNVVEAMKMLVSRVLNSIRAKYVHPSPLAFHPSHRT